ncbi:MAG: hypothetical protein VX777_00430 [Chlamydiota bacterium]|nr:hypothetical protein [Chlamydiota bacterium]
MITDQSVKVTNNLYLTPTQTHEESNESSEGVKHSHLSNQTASLPNLFKQLQKLATIIKGRGINQQLSEHLSNQLNKIHQFKDMNDIDEMEKCTQLLEDECSHHKVNKCVKQLFSSLYNSLEDKRSEMICKSIINNLEHELNVFNEDFLSQSLRHKISIMLDTVQLVHKIPNRQYIYDVFFWGTFPLAEAYRRLHFNSEVYDVQGRAIFHKEIESYIYHLSKHIERFKTCNRFLKMHTQDFEKPYDTISRIAAKISLMERPIPMMIELYEITKHVEVTFSDDINHSDIPRPVNCTNT